MHERHLTTVTGGRGMYGTARRVRERIITIEVRRLELQQARHPSPAAPERPLS